MLFRCCHRLCAAFARSASGVSHTLSALTVDCEALQSPQGFPLNGPWTFNPVLSPAEALEPEFIGDSKSVSIFP